MDGTRYSGPLGLGARRFPDRVDHPSAPCVAVGRVALAASRIADREGGAALVMRGVERAPHVRNAEGAVG